MLNASRLLCAQSVFFCLLLTAAGSTAEAQTTSTNPALDRQLSRIDIGVLGVGVFNKSSNGFATVNGRANTAVTSTPAIRRERWSPSATQCHHSSVLSSTTATRDTPTSLPLLAHSQTAAYSRTQASTRLATSSMPKSSTLE